MSATRRRVRVPVSAGKGPALRVEETNHQDGIKTGPDDGLRLREAALLLGCTEKTLRRRIQEGEVNAWTVEGRRGLEWRVSLPEDRSEDRPQDRSPQQQGRSEGQPQDRPEDRQETGLTVRLEMTETALLEARTRAERDREEARADRERMVGEVEFLRQQLQSRTDAERELRLLLASTQQALQAIAERPALPPASTLEETPPPRRRWWYWWRR